MQQAAFPCVGKGCAFFDKLKSRCPKAAAFVSKYELGIIRKD
jgi:hypothetical protein